MSSAITWRRSLPGAVFLLIAAYGLGLSALLLIRLTALSQSPWIEFFSNILPLPLQQPAQATVSSRSRERFFHASTPPRAPSVTRIAQSNAAIAIAAEPAATSKLPSNADP